MDYIFSRCWLIVIIYFSLTDKALSASSVDAKNNTKLTANSLVKIGDRLNNPLLRLVGKTLKNFEKEITALSENIDEYESTRKETREEMCRLHPCSHWSDWSKCDATVLGQFGGQTRRRKCGYNTTLCERQTEITEDVESKLCEYRCPEDYTVTKHGFCLKLYATPKSPRGDAEAICRNDGGHLVNIDSYIKVSDANETLAEKSYPDRFLWIDGLRSVQGGPWKYGYQSDDPSFTFWGDNDPDNGPTELCMLYHKTGATGHLWRKFDYPCKEKLGFMCQIIM